MRQSTRDKRTYLIIGLCMVVVMMAVGFAAFAQRLQINGTSEVTSNWCVGFDTSKTTDYVATPGLSGGTTPTATMSYSGNTCGSDNLQTEASLSASFKQPGDQVVYTFTIKNASSLNAKIDSITENLTTSNSAIEYTLSGAKANDILGPNDEATLVVTVRYKNSITSQPEVMTWGLELKLNFSQTNDLPAPASSQTTFTGTIYRNNDTEAAIGDSIVPGSGTKYVITNGEMDAPLGPYETEEECNADKVATGAPDGWYCQQKSGVGEYTTDAFTLGKTYYLKHDVVDDIITASYVCFVTDKEYCMQGGNSSYYSLNKTLLQGQETWFNNHSGGCTFGDSNSNCTGGVNSVGANSSGYVEVVFESGGCFVEDNGDSKCYFFDPVGGEIPDKLPDKG